MPTTLAKNADATNPFGIWFANSTTLYVADEGDGTTANPATDGLRNITGRNNGDGTVTIWAVTSTVSANGDQGADPNKLVAVNDILDNTDPAIAPFEPFTTLVTAGYAEVLRGAFTPGTLARHRGAGR